MCIAREAIREETFVEAIKWKALFSSTQIAQQVPEEGKQKCQDEDPKTQGRKKKKDKKILPRYLYKKKTNKTRREQKNLTIQKKPQGKMTKIRPLRYAKPPLARNILLL